MLNVLDRLVLAVRFILVGFYLGLAVALAFYCIHFLGKVWKFTGQVMTPDSTPYLLSLLELVDSGLVAGLVVMVILSSWDSFVSPLSKNGGIAGSKIEWVSQLDPTNLKTKLATAIVAISSIHLLQVFMRTENYPDRAIFWAVVIHIAFVVGALALFWMDYTGSAKKVVSGPQMRAGAPAPPKPVHGPDKDA